MATRIYTEATDFDVQQGHFTIEVVDSQYYLRIGALNSEDQRLIRALIDDGFVGFFQDDVRIGIAGIASIYDATNDWIEIDRELPELQIEDAYVIRFTQARPGEDGEGGIGTPGEDGKPAEIEIEDTNTGIRVRGKSGGEPDFGPWQDVRDGIDGQDGIDGEPGEDGEDGEPGRDGEDGQPAEIEIEDTPANDPEGPGIRVRGKSGGEPDFGSWFHVRDGIDGQDGEPGQDGEDGQDGEPGQDGNDGEDGDDGWSPKFATVSDGERRVLQVADWFGGGGTKPETGQYIGETGFVTTIGEGVDIRGPAGQAGEDGGPGPPGPPGQDGIGNVQMTAGLFTPEALTIHYHNLNGQWSARIPSNSWISISGETGVYYRWGNYVLFYACLDVDIGSSLNGKARHARIFIAPPHGRNSRERLADAHGMGTPIKEKAGWFPVEVTIGDHDSDVDRNGNPTGGSINNSIKVDCIAVNQSDGSSFGAITISGMYKIMIT